MPFNSYKLSSPLPPHIPTHSTEHTGIEVYRYIMINAVKIEKEGSFPVFRPSISQLQILNFSRNDLNFQLKEHISAVEQIVNEANHLLWQLTRVYNIITSTFKGKFFKY